MHPHPCVSHLPLNLYIASLLKVVCIIEMAGA